MGLNYQRCLVCIMDTTDPEIIFFGSKGCNHCIGMKSSLGKIWFNDNSGEVLLKGTIERIREEGKGLEYDSILGLSGGVDSSYVALKAHDWGLRPLVVHVDGGWNSEPAVRNIESILEFTGWDLHTSVINWPEMQDLQLSYFKSGISNLDVPQDHAFFSSLYTFAAQNRIKHVLSGGNMATEGIFPRVWHGAAMDSNNLRAIQKQFGQLPLMSYPTTTFYQYYVKHPFIKKIRLFRPLNFIPYNKNNAIAELENRIGYKRYPRKHGESIFTRFFQEYFLIQKYGIDKRLAHFSSEIVSGQLSRDLALQFLGEEMYSRGELERDMNFISRKLGIQRLEFDSYLTTPVRSYEDFATWNAAYNRLKQTQSLLEKLLRRKIGTYS